MFKNRIFFLSLLFLALFSSLSAQLKVVSLSPIASKSMVLLGATDLVVGCTQWCPFASEKTIVANAIDVNIELVLTLQPDIIFASTLTSKESINTLRQLGLSVILLPRTTSFDNMCEELITIGQKINKFELAKQEVAIAQQHLIEVKKDINTTMKPNVMFQVGAKPIFAAIPNTFVDDYIIQAGAINIYSDLDHGTVTRESVLLRNPDAIFISTMPTAAEDVRSSWLKYDDLSASQNNNVVLIDQEIASSPTIHTFVEVVEKIIQVLYL